MMRFPTISARVDDGPFCRGRNEVYWLWRPSRDHRVYRHVTYRILVAVICQFLSRRIEGAFCSFKWHIGNIFFCFYM